MGGDETKAKARVLGHPGGSVRPAPGNAMKRWTLGYATQTPLQRWQGAQGWPPRPTGTLPMTSPPRRGHSGGPLGGGCTGLAGPTQCRAALRVPAPRPAPAQPASVPSGFILVYFV